MTAPTPTPSAAPFSAQTPEDVLAVVPVVLGFVPSESIAMLTFGTGVPFHARSDLPQDRAELARAVEVLLDPARRHGVERALFVVYSGDPVLAETAGRGLAAAFEAHGIEVVGLLRADGERWWRVGEAGRGMPYDLTTHPFSARAVLEGRVLHRSRDEVRAGVARVPALVTGVVAALAAPRERSPSPGWICELLTRHVGERTAPDDAEVARLLRALLEPRGRDEACAGLTRASARGHVAFWTDVVRRAPDPLVATPAALLALAAWQDGDGALAWCALDRCTDVDPEHPLGVLVERVLLEAVPPDAWEAHG
ncbi:MAG: DUF4192 domain-containing protein [Nocardioides sp.]